MNCEASPTGPPISASPIARPAEAAAFWKEPAVRLPAWRRPLWMWTGICSSWAASQKGSSSAERSELPDG